MKIVFTKWMRKNTRGKAFWPFVFVKKGLSQVEMITVINHETTHIKQQQEMLVVFAIVWYWTEMIARLLIYKLNYKKAYDLHSMEREARENQEDITYNVRRAPYSFILYL